MSLYWVHQDCLTAEWFGNGRAVFVFDPVQIEASGWGLKRLLFVYECLLELPVEIHRGPLVETLLTLTENRQIVTVDSPDPWLCKQMKALQGAAKLEILPTPPFFEPDGELDLQRFSRYWRKAEAKVLR